MNRKVLQVVISVALIGGSVVYLMQDTMSDQMEYFHPADAVIVKGAELSGKRMRMGGQVAKGSIFQKKGTLEYAFEVAPIDGMLDFPEAEGKTVPVRYEGVVPDTFKDEAQVIVSGQLDSSGVFHAEDILAKCPSKYEATEKEKGEY